jgi:hypothetical protein
LDSEAGTEIERRGEPLVAADRLAQAIRRLIGRALERDDVVTLTEVCRLILDGVGLTKTAQDREFAEHVTFVVNQSLQEIRNGDLSKSSLEKCGKYLLRLWRVYRLYRKKEGSTKFILNKVLEIRRAMKGGAE